MAKGSYEALAAVYDRLNEFDYAGYADYIEAAFARYGVRPALVLDLGCGTGSMTVELARRGYDMIGVDGSERMLARAYARSRAAGLDGILYLAQDMRAFELYGTVGAVVSTLDCVNYLTGREDLSRCFSLVHNYLDPDGLFLFDVNTPFKFETVYGDRSYILEEADAFCAWRNAYDRRHRRCRFSLSVFTREGDGRWRRADEEQVERCYTREELTRALEGAGFCDIAFFGGPDFAPPDAETERWYVAARCRK